MAARCRDRSAWNRLSNDLSRAVCLDPSAVSPKRLLSPVAATATWQYRPPQGSTQTDPHDGAPIPTRQQTSLKHLLIRSRPLGLPPNVKERPRNVAAVRRNTRVPGMRVRCLRVARTAPECESGVAGKYPRRVLTTIKAEDYIAPTTARRPLRRDDAPAKLLTNGVTGLPITIGSHEFRRLFGLPEREDRLGPGLFEK